MKIESTTHIVTLVAVFAMKFHRLSELASVFAIVENEQDEFSFIIHKRDTQLICFLFGRWAGLTIKCDRSSSLEQPNRGFQQIFLCRTTFAAMDAPAGELLKCHLAFATHEVDIQMLLFIVSDGRLVRWKSPLTYQALFNIHQCRADFTFTRLPKLKKLKWIRKTHVNYNFHNVFEPRFR